MGATGDAANANKQLKDSLPTAEIQEINRTLDDYAGMAERANAAARQAKADFDAGKISAEAYGKIMLEASDANAALAEATEKTAAGEQKADEARKKTIPTIAQQAEQAKALSDGYSKLQSATTAYYDALIEQAKAEGRISDARKLTIEKLNEQARLQALIAEQKRLEAEAAREVLTVLESEIARRKAANEEISKDLELKLQQQQLAVKIAEAEAGTATAKTETAKAAAELTAKTQAFIAAGYDEIEAKKLALLASNQYTAAMKLEEEQRKKTTEAAEKQKDADARVADALRAAVASAEQAADAAKAAADQTQAASNFASGALQGWSDRLGALSDKARQAFDGYDEGAQGAADSSQELADAVAGLATGGYVEWANRVAIRALEIEQRFNGQAAAAANLTQRLTAMADGGRTDLAALAEATRGVSGQFDLLDQQRLDSLQSAIDRAKDSMDALRQASEDALLAAQRALLQQQGDDAGLLEVERKQTVLGRVLN